MCAPAFPAKNAKRRLDPDECRSAPSEKVGGFPVSLDPPRSILRRGWVRRISRTRKRKVRMNMRNFIRWTFLPGLMWLRLRRALMSSDCMRQMCLPKRIENSSSERDHGESDYYFVLNAPARRAILVSRKLSQLLGRAPLYVAS